MVVVVLGMHGSGTSLVAGMLQAMGVAMHPNPKGQVKWYRTNEDAGFMRLNVQILKNAGGNWRKPPPHERVLAVGRSARIERRVKSLVRTRARAGGRWGWKDPRNCLTAAVYHPHLKEPRYVLVARGLDATAASLVSRGGSEPAERWKRLARTYVGRAKAFLASVDATRMTVSYEKLTGADGLQEARRLAKFVGAPRPGKAARRAMKCVRKK